MYNVTQPEVKQSVLGHKPPDKKPPNQFAFRRRPSLASLATGGIYISSHANGFRFDGK